MPIYDLKDNLFLFDETFKKNLFFEDEIDENNFKKVKAKRYIINKESLDDYLYISTLLENKTKDGIAINFLDCNILLIPCGSSIYYLAYNNAKDINLYSMLYTFMENNNCKVDITRYHHLFKKYETLSLYVRKEK